MADGVSIATLVIVVLILISFWGLLVAAVLMVPGWVEDTTNEVTESAGDSVSDSINNTG